tara:strand:+ start:175 stop:324 length:150 start_codon:yes stop_codon:yes gene_type:complete
MAKRSEYRILKFGGTRRIKKTGSMRTRGKTLETFKFLDFTKNISNIRRK